MSPRKQHERIEEDLLIPAIGAMIYASDEPVPAKEIADVLGGLEPSEVEEAIETLSTTLATSGVGLEVERVAGGYRLATRSDIGAWVRKFFQQRNRTRLSPAALETLAIVAYRQPVTSPEIQAIRGKDPGASLKSLLDKKMIRIIGKKKVVGNPLLYGTRKQFLVHFGLDRLGDLPSIDDFDEFLGVLESDQGQLFEAAPGDVEIVGDAPEIDAATCEPLEAESTAATLPEAVPVESDPVAVPVDRRAAEELEILARVPENEESH